MPTMREKLAGLVAEELAEAESTDFEAMTIDEIDDWVVAHRPIANLEEFRATALAVAEVRNRKVAAWHLEEATRQINRVATEEGLTPGQVARLWLDSAQEGRQVQGRLYLGLPRTAELSREDLMAQIQAGVIRVSPR